MSIEFDISNYIIDLNKFDVVKKNKWRGSCGYISIVKDKNSNTQYVAKVLKDSLKNKANAQRNFFNYLRIEHVLRGFPNIVNFIGFNLSNFQDSDNSINPTMLFEFVSNGTLNQYFNYIQKKNNYLTNTKKQICMIGIAIGANIIHQKGIVHLDLKPDNILLDENLYPKISDFGSAKFLKQQFQKNPEDNDDKAEGDFPSSDVSAPLYTSPEVIKLTSFDEKADVYSYAYILYRIISGIEPTIESSSILELFNNILKGKRPDLSIIHKKQKKFSKTVLQLDKLENLLISDSQNDENINCDSFAKLISDCWNQDPKNRPNFIDIINRLLTNKNLLLPDVDLEEVNNYLKKFDEFETTPQISHDSNDRKRYFHFRTNYNNVLMEQKNGINSKKPNKHDIPDYDDLDELCKNQIDEALNKEDIESCATVGYNLANGFNGFPKCINESIKYLKIAIEGGNPSAMNTFASLLLQKSASSSGYLKERRNEAAKQLYKIAADLGNTFAMMTYSKILYHESKKGEKNSNYNKIQHNNNSSESFLSTSSILLSSSFSSAVYSRSSSGPVDTADNDNDNDKKSKKEITGDDDNDIDKHRIQSDSDNDISEEYNDDDTDYNEQDIEVDSSFNSQYFNNDSNQQFEEEEEDISEYDDNENESDITKSNESEYSNDDDEASLRESKWNEAKKYMKMAADSENLIAINMYNEMFVKKEEKKVKTFSKSTYSTSKNKLDQE